MSDTIVLVLIGVATLALRASFILGAKKGARPHPVLSRFIPVAALSALIAPSLSAPTGEAFYARPLVAAVAALIAWRTKNVFVTVALGLALLWWIR